MLVEVEFYQIHVNVIGGWSLQLEILCLKQIESRKATWGFP